MTPPKDKKKRPAKNSAEKSGNDVVPILRIKRGASLKEKYAAARRAFSAADLAKYAEIEEGIPAARVLAELEAVDREEAEKRKWTKKHDRSR